MSDSPPIVLDLVRADDRSHRLAPLVDAKNRVFKPVFNGAGTFSLTIPIDSLAAYQVRNRATAVLFTRRGHPVWSGSVTSVVKQAAAGVVNITATGFQEELESRFVRKAEEGSLVFGSPGTVGGTILSYLISTVNVQQDSEGNVRPVRLAMGSVGDSQVRTNQYKQGDQVWAKAKELIDVENGLDVSIDPITLLLSTRASQDFMVRPAVKFGWGIKPNNLDDVEENADGTTIKNRINVVIASGLVCTADDPVAIDYSGVMLEEWISATDIVDPAIGLALANAELVYKRYGTVVYRLTPKQYGDIPRPYDDFQWGDQASLSVDRDSLQVNGLGVRLFAGTLTYTDEGDEIVSEIQVVAS